MHGVEITTTEDFMEFTTGLENILLPNVKSFSLCAQDGDISISLRFQSACNIADTFLATSFRILKVLGRSVCCFQQKYHVLRADFYLLKIELVHFLYDPLTNWSANILVAGWHFHG